MISYDTFRFGEFLKSRKMSLFLKLLVVSTALLKRVIVVESLRFYGDPDVDTSTLYDDFHYPAEETYERERAQIPILIQINQNSATISRDNESLTVREGDVAFDVWDVRAVSNDFVVLNRNFDRWGLLAYLSTTSSWSERKTIGTLSKIDQP